MIFYTYLWLREDGTPYYVGKGSGRRATRKRRGSPPRDRILVQDFISEAEAFEAEKILIAYYGRKDIGTGTLINLNDGGEGGMSGYVMPEERKEKLRKSMRGNKYCLGITHSEAWKKDQSDRMLGHPVSEETKEKIGLANTGNKYAIGCIRSLEERSTISNKMKEIWAQRKAHAASSSL